MPFSFVNLPFVIGPSVMNLEMDDKNVFPPLHSTQKPSPRSQRLLTLFGFYLCLLKWGWIVGVTFFRREKGGPGTKGDLPRDTVPEQYWSSKVFSPMGQGCFLIEQMCPWVNYPWPLSFLPVLADELSHLSASAPSLNRYYNLREVVLSASHFMEEGTEA